MNIHDFFSGLTIEIPHHVDIQNNNHVSTLTSPNVSSKQASPRRLVGQLFQGSRPQNNM